MWSFIPRIFRSIDSIQFIDLKIPIEFASSWVHQLLNIWHARVKRSLFANSHQININAINSKVGIDVNLLPMTYYLNISIIPMFKWMIGHCKLPLTCSPTIFQWPSTIETPISLLFLLSHMYHMCTWYITLKGRFSMS